MGPMFDGYIRYVVVFVIVVIATITSPIVISHDHYVHFFDHIDRYFDTNCEFLLSKYGFITMIILVGIFIILYVK